MSDTRLQTSIIEAIQIITDRKVSQASFDKTIKAIVKQVSNQTIGEYLIKYQDSEFIAYATSAEIHYKKGDQVFILIPGNDWSRTKTIIGGTNQKATTFVEPPAARNAYNTIGRNGVISIAKDFSYPYKLNSYRNIFMDLYRNTPDGAKILNIDQKGIIKNIKESGGLAVGAYFKTQLDDSQVGGDYGLIFNLQFSDSTVNSSAVAATKPYVLNSNNVIGNPYLIRDYTYVSSFIDDINTDQLVGIESVQIYCTGFNSDNVATSTDIINGDGSKSLIYVKDIQIQAIESLTTQELNGYSLNIDCSNTGNILGQTTAGTVSQIQLNAELKSKGKVVTKDVEYYWFRQNSTILRGNQKYSSYGGDGWECLNWINQSPVPYKDGKITFINKNSKQQSIKDRKIPLLEKTTRIKCVATYKDLSSTSKEMTLINNNINENIIITSSDRISQNEFKTIYYLDNGHPTLTCEVKNDDESDFNGNLSYEWYQTQSNGRSKKIESNTTIKNNYYLLKNKVESINNQANKLASASREKYLNQNNRRNDLSKWEKQKDTVSFIDGNKYINFPINSILNSKKISCAVYNNDNYIGTGSITLYNKQQLAGMYSVVMNNGSQVFHYDGKGNSPASPQIERPLQIQPLTFGLLDKDGTQIPYEQIIKSGEVKWIIPKNQTLLIPDNSKNQYSDKEKEQNPKDGEWDLDLNKITLPLAASNYNVYKNIPIFYFTIANQYDVKNSYNDILLHIKYKDLIFDTYTNFSFPKQGDPGTNGTDYVAKIVGKITDTKNSSSDRLYISNQFKNDIFDDNGVTITKLLFQLYNNSVKINSSNVTWSILKGEKNSNLNIDINKGTLSIKDSKVNNAIDIIRASIKINNNLNCFAQMPICTNRIENIKSTIEGANYTTTYRIKVVPKTGFKYVMYSQDGVRPDYDNSLPFEIIVQNYNIDNYFEVMPAHNYSYSWSVIGNLIKKSSRSNIAYIEPKQYFDGYDLTSAVECTVKKGSTIIGTIHIPIYMYLNRYGHTALNEWDGNSIDLGTESGVILAPQVGAGKKEDGNTFTGVLLGTQKDNKGKQETGLFGYDKGQRSIFLDASTGKAQFGKDNAAKIILDPWSKMNGKDVAFLHSSTFNVNKYKENKGAVKKDTSYGSGLIIDLTSPAIQFGSGKFYVNSAGQIHAAGGGDIAGWTIGDQALFKNNVGMNSNPNNTNGKKAFYANDSFYVTHNGYLFSTSGKIGGWEIGEKALSNSNVGMNSDPNNSKYPSITGHNSKAFFATDKFYVTHDGYLFSTSGNIAGWSISTDKLQKTDKKDIYIGMGDRTFYTSNSIDTPRQYFDTKNNIIARFWSVNNKNKNYMFLVDNQGRLFSNSGQIGGWTINSSKLTAKNIIIDSTGKIQTNNFSSSKKDNATGWSINSNGQAIFNYIQANTGSIGDWLIKEGEIRDTQKAEDAHVRLYKNDKGQGCLKANRGTIGGWTITGSTIQTTAKNQTVKLSIDSNGSLSGPSWQITSGGDAYFKNLYGTIKDGKTLSGGGASIGNGGLTNTGSISLGGNGSIGGCEMKEGVLNVDSAHIKDLSVDKIYDSNDKTASKGVEWQQISVITKRSMSWEHGNRFLLTKKSVSLSGSVQQDGSVTVSGDLSVESRDVVWDLESTSWYRKLYLLVGKGALTKGEGES